MGSGLPPQLASIEKEVRDIFKVLTSGFQKLDQTKDEGKQTKQLEGLTAKMREAKRLIKEFDREMKEEEGNINPESNKLLNEKKQSLIKELNSFVALRKTYTSSIGSKHELLDGVSHAGSGRDMSSQEHILTGEPQVDERIETIERTDKVMRNTTNGAETATIVKVEPEQVTKLKSKVDTSEPSTGIRKMARNRCILLILLLILLGIIVIIMLKVVQPDDKVQSSAPTPLNRRLLMTTLDFQ
ncbi:hypothetical protein KC19_7G017500 [Ceratodon purpureus]|uniref:Uncharacterized protein n=1 Tax=Ceratodon purpureus TaxID=3225 RepID=A0A8T0H3E9_CERPU|nr:hypothetical protein KC19_7G017500 [Ceratodon purpureus]